MPIHLALFENDLTSDPDDYAVHEAWIVFRLNEAPIRTEREGDFDAVCLMDAASCYILGMELVAARAAEVPAPVAEGLIEMGRAAANGEADDG